MNEVCIVSSTDELDADLDLVSDTLVGLEELYLSVDNMLQQGGLNANSAVMLQIAVGQLCQSTPISPIKLPSLESYSGNGALMEETLLGLEGLGDMIKQAVEWFLALIAKFKKKIVDMWTSRVSTVLRLIDRDISVIEKITSSGDNPVKPNINVSDAVWHDLFVGGDKFECKQIAEGIENLHKAVNETSTYIATDTFVNKYLLDMQKVLDTSNHTDECVSSHNADDLTIESVVKYITTHSTIKIVQDTNRENTYIGKDQYIGGKRLVYKFKTSTAFSRVFNRTQKETDVVGISISLEDTGDTPVQITGKDHLVKAPDKKDILELLKKVRGLLDVVAISKQSLSSSRAKRILKR